MKTRWFVAAAVTVVVLAGCGSSSSSKPESGSRGTAPSTSAKALRSPEQLRGALLTVADLPTGWASGMGQLSDNSDSSPQSDSMCPAAKNAFPDELDKSSNSGISAEFNKAQLGPFVFEGLTADENAKAILTTADAALRSCVGQTWDETDKDGTKTTFTLAEVSMPKHGNQQVAYRITGNATGALVSVDLVVVRVDRVVVAFAGMGVNTILGGGQLDSAEFEHIVSTGVEKLTRV